MSNAPILGPVNHVRDISSADELAKKHTPLIELSRSGARTVVTVRVGHYAAHPNQPDHYIAWIEVYANEAPIARFELSPVVTDPVVSVVVDIDPGTSVRAVEHCNLHGLWAAEETL